MKKALNIIFIKILLYSYTLVQALHPWKLKKLCKKITRAPDSQENISVKEVNFTCRPTNVILPEDTRPK